MAQLRFWQELKRRHVYRVAAAYAVIGWLLIQVVTQVFPIFQLPLWVVRAIVLLILIGFPIALVLAWAFDATPQGIVLTDALPEDAADQPVRKSRRTGVALAALGGVVALLAGIGWWQSQRARMPARIAASPAAAVTAPALPDGPTATQPIPAKSIAVLPFENLSADPDNAYFAAGMRDLILARLAGIRDLKVIARTSTDGFASRPDDVASIARQLAVATLLEGSVQKSGNQVLITVQLIDASTSAHVWAQTYQRTLDNVFGVEGEVAQTIADALHANLTTNEADALKLAESADPLANDLYLRADYLFQSGMLDVDAAILRQAIALYGAAIARDPDFAMALARRSYAANLLAWLGGEKADRAQLFTAARADAERAVALAPRLAFAHVAMGYSDYFGRGDYRRAANAFRNALILHPNDSEALLAMGLLQRRTGDIDAARASFVRALQVDPRNTILISGLGEVEMMRGDYARARQWFLREQAMNPTHLDARAQLALIDLLARGDVEAALRQVQGDAPRLRQTRVQLLILQRRYREALDELHALPEQMVSLTEFDPGLAEANLYRLLGDAARARPLFEQVAAKATARVDASPTIKTAYVWLELADARLGLGDSRASLAALTKALAIVAAQEDRVDGPRIRYNAAALYVRLQRPDPAVSLLGRMLATPGAGLQVSPQLLRVDPAWDPIRDTPGFKALLARPQAASGDGTPAPAGL